MIGRLAALLPGLRPRLALAVLLGFGAAASGLALMGISGYLISRAALRPPVLELMVVITAVRASALARAVLRYAERLVTHDVSFRLLARLRTWLYRRLEPLLPAGLGEMRTGDVLSRLVGDVDILQDVFIRALAPPFVAALVLGLATGVLWPLAPAAVPALAAPLIVAGAGLPWLAHRLSRRPALEQAALRGRLAAGLVELLAGAGDLAAFGGARGRTTEIAALDAKLARAGRRLASITGAVEGAQLAFAGIALTGVLAVAAPAAVSGRLDGVWVATIALVTLAAFEAVQPLPDAFQRWERGLASARRALEVADTPPPAIDRAHPRIARTGALALEGAWLRYRPDAPWALEDVSLALEPGQRIALVGPSGAGKTSVANVFLRFHELSRGRATLNGRDLREHDQSSIRRVIGLCAQDAHVFATTLLENVRLARPDATIPEIEAAAERAGLLRWVRELPAGWQTPAGDAGDQLSGGQRQRLALARALLADFPTLILDEPTAHLDEPLARSLMTDVLAATEGKSLLLITHRREAMEAMDGVVTLEAGRTATRGILSGA